MARKPSKSSHTGGGPHARQPRVGPGGDWLFPRLATESELEEASLLDVIDNVLNHGVVLQGDLILGVANVDLIYVKLSALLAALDKITKGSPPAARSRRPHAAGIAGIDHAHRPRHDEKKDKSPHARPRRRAPGKAGPHARQPRVGGR
jgi:hypothetical protein